MKLERLLGYNHWSDTANHCTVPGCTEAGITVTVPVTVTVEDTDGLPKEGLPVYAFSGGVYTGYTKTTDASGQVQLTLPQGDYRFRADLNGTQFWSGTTDHCTLPGCLEALVEITGGSARSINRAAQTSLAPDPTTPPPWC